MQPRILHYSREKLTRIRSAEQVAFDAASPKGRADKPNGLWVSIEGEDDWPSYCNGGSVPPGQLAYEITLADDANLLWIVSESQLDAFSAEYSFDPYGIGLGSIHGVRWEDVAPRYQGIIIAPYCWSRRLTGHTFWYYSWDCASGCIWDAAAIASFNPL